MKLKSILLGITLMASGAAFAGESWDSTDKALFTAFTAVRAVDMAQTINIARNPEQYREATNPFLGSHPSEGKVIGFFILSHALIWLGADYMSPKARKIFLTGGIVIEAAFVGHNAKIGIKASF